MGVLDRLIDDAALLAGDRPADAVVQAYDGRRRSADAHVLDSLLVPEDRLTEVARAATGLEAPLPVTVVIGGGAGGLIALARRTVPGVSVVAAQLGIRDLDDPAGNAARVVAAAIELDGIDVVVELPDAPGWVGAVEELEAAGLYGALRVDEATAGGTLAERLSVLVEADLPFAITGDVGHAAADAGVPGIVTLMLALEALIDGAEPAEAADLLPLVDEQRIRAALAAWDDAAATRIRRRLRRISTVRVDDALGGLRRLGLLDG